MASWDEPSNSDPNHVNVLGDLRNKDTYALTMGQAGGSYTNRPEGEMLYDNSAKLFKRLTSSVEVIQQVSIAGGGTGSGTSSGARAALNVHEAGTSSGQSRTNAQSDAIHTPLTRTISTIGTLNGGGDLSGNLTLSVDEGSTAQPGTLQLRNNLTSGETTRALTAAQGKVLKDVQDANKTEFDDHVSSRTPLLVWSGSDTQVTAAEILADTGFVLKAGRYIVEANALDYSIVMRGATDVSRGTSSVDISSNDLVIQHLRFSGSVFSVLRSKQGDVGSTNIVLTNIWFTPL